jgi:hypothetical protein
MSTYTPQDYTKNLAASMQRSKDMIAGQLLRQKMGKRLKQENPYIHGARDAIREQTETL